jgi:hypothetical protein
LKRASTLGDPTLLAATHGEIGSIAFYCGEFDRVQRHTRTRIVSEWLFEPEICVQPDFEPGTSGGQRFTMKNPLDPTG